MANSKIIHFPRPFKGPARPPKKQGGPTAKIIPIALGLGGVGVVPAPQVPQPSARTRNQFFRIWDSLMQKLDSTSDDAEPVEVWLDQEKFPQWQIWLDRQLVQAGLKGKVAYTCRSTGRFSALGNQYKLEISYVEASGAKKRPPGN